MHLVDVVIRRRPPYVRRRRRVDVLVVVVLLVTCSWPAVGDQQSAVQRSDQLNYCSFFNNRAPKAQPGLQNCTWFKENSCCLEQEIEATFGRVKPLKGASPACQRYVNYLMCYICAPNQNVFYQKERLTVCEQFCDQWYGACSSAILKGSIIGELYESGTEFCRSRRFLVSRQNCFYFDQDMDTTSSGPATGPATGSSLSRHLSYLVAVGLSPYVVRV